MNSTPLKLSEMVTQWTVVLRAVSSNPDATAIAEVLPRYCEAVHRYLRVVLQDPDAADDICQEFAYRFARGDFRNVRPEKGRFRDYLKVAVFRMVQEHRRKLFREANRAEVDLDSLAAPESAPADEFEAACRVVLIERSWTDLQRSCTDEHPSLYDVLRRKAAAPELTSQALAEALTAEFGRPFEAANVRQMIHRARKQFSLVLRGQVAALQPAGEVGGVDDELARLGLLAYCVPGR